MKALHLTGPTGIAGPLNFRGANCGWTAGDAALRHNGWEPQLFLQKRKLAETPSA